MLSAPVSFDYVEGNDIADLDTTKPDANCADNKDAVVAGLAGVPIINSWSPDAEILMTRQATLQVILKLHLM